MTGNHVDQFADHHYHWRLLGTAVLGFMGAMLLTWFMHQLIHSSQHKLDESGRASMLDFVRVKRDEASQKKENRLTRPTQADAPPAPAVPQTDSSSADASLMVSVLPDGANVDLQIGGLGFGGSDGEYLPIVKVAPIYPRQALNLTIQGECFVKYTVTTTGATKDVEVIRDRCAHPAFYRSSIEAARKFKYKPRIIDGDAIEVHDVYNRFIYEIEK